MKVIRSITERLIPGQSVVTIGNFDGLHLGHRAIIDEVKRLSDQVGATAVAITFEPHPLEVLVPEKAPKLLMTTDQKTRILANTGIDLLMLQDFDIDFLRLSAESFIEDYLINYFKARIICVGHNFRFGYRHEGNVDTLLKYKEKFEVVEVPPVTVSNTQISSSSIRKHLENGNLKVARKMLGRPYEIEGKVVPGFSRGRRETVPTINIGYHGELLPADGVYISRIALDGGTFLPAVTNVGFRPTFDGEDRSVETYVLDSLLKENPAYASLQFIKRLRSEEKYSSAAKLKLQIERDTNRARRFFYHLASTLKNKGSKKNNSLKRDIDKEIQIKMYSRPDCHLCDKAHLVIEQARSQHIFNFQVVNIEGDSELEAAYGKEIPVICINGDRAFKHEVDPSELKRKLERLWSP